MPGADVGYIRVSTVEQNLDRQLDGVHLDKVFEDKVTGSTRVRPGLEACLAYLREGDTLHVHSIDRLARDFMDMYSLVKELTGKGVCVVFHKENMTFDGSSTDPRQNLLFHILGSFAEFERALIRERQKEGLAIARKAGKHMGRPRRLADDDVELLRRERERGVPVARIAKNFGLPRSTVYTYLKVKRHP